jgi:hypothetical protein
MAQEEGGIGWGVILAGLAGIIFIAFVSYKISKKREELRNTIELLAEQHDPIVGELHALVDSGELVAMSLG